MPSYARQCVRNYFRLHHFGRDAGSYSKAMLGLSRMQIYTVISEAEQRVAVSAGSPLRIRILIRSPALWSAQFHGRTIQHIQPPPLRREIHRMRPICLGS